MFKWTEVIDGELTKKQQQALETMKTILMACNDSPKTMREIKNETKLSTGVLSKHLRELIRQGLIEGRVAINKANRMEIVFAHKKNPPALTLKGKKPQSVTENVRFYVPKDKTKPIRWQIGYFRNVKGKRGKRKRFFSTSGPPKIKR